MSLLVNIEHEVIHLKHKQEKFKHKHEHDLKHYHGDNEATHNLRRLIAEREEHITTFNRMFKVINFLAGMLHHKVPEQHNHDFEKLHHEEFFAMSQCVILIFQD